MEAPPNIESLSLAQIAELVEQKKLPPVSRWNPERSGDSEMRIASDGSWFHQGSLIGRPAMVRLFSTILRREADDSYVLVTPVEKLSIEVEDAPFLAVELKTEGEGATREIAFRLNTGDLAVVDADHPLIVRDRADGPHPYVLVRDRLEALIARPVYYELVNLAMDEAPDAEALALWSRGTRFALGPEN